MYKLSLNENHRHVVAELDKDGNGRSTVDNKHSHKIVNRKVQRAGKNNHNHKLIKTKVLQEKESEKRIKTLKKGGYEIKKVEDDEGNIVVLKRKKKK